MPGTACLGVHAEGQQLALVVVRVGVAAGADRGEADHLVTGAGDEQLVPGVGGVASEARQTRAKARALEPLQHLGGEGGGVRVAPHGRLHQTDGRHVAGTGDADAGVGDGCAATVVVDQLGRGGVRGGRGRAAPGHPVTVPPI